MSSEILEKLDILIVWWTDKWTW